MPHMREAMQLWEDWIVANLEPVGLDAGDSQRDQQRGAGELGDGPRCELGDHGIVTRPTSTIAAAIYPRTHSAAAHVSRTSSPRTT